METGRPCKVSETQFMWLGVYNFRNFWVCPGEHYRFWPVPGARNLHLFIDIIHDCCSHMIPLVHLKKINSSKTVLIYNTALKNKKVRTGLATHFIRGTIRENTNR